MAYYSLMFFIAYAFKGQEHLFAGRVKIVSHSSCRTGAILKYIVPCLWMKNNVDTNHLAHQKPPTDLDLEIGQYTEQLSLRLLGNFTCFFFNSFRSECQTVCLA